MSAAPVMEVQGLSKHFRKDDEELIALRDVDLTVEQGSFVVLLGRSGCGKSTLLNLLAGLTPPTSGQITYHGKPMRGPNTQVGYLTQHDTLMPWRDVTRNVEMPRELRGDSKKERAAVTAELIKLVGLSGFERHYPRELSGGMRRRASLARMLCADPETLLLDEPFGALDAQLRTELQGELLRLWSGSGRTVVFVTHDIEEALILADRVVVLGPIGTILLDQPVDLPRPRDPDDIRVDPHFVELHRRLSAALKEGAR
ncbi:ABC transporter ATP-binding protein [Micromonospora sp. NPDC023966]|uniref:ABC transporter ATP-binding protein n=1 Tax=Micromonospora sp. NPDC023966 TaxID=3154699 RepID=UPI0033F9CDA9